MRFGCQLDDVEFLPFPFTGNKLLLGGALITGVFDGPFVLRTEVLFQPSVLLRPVTDTTATNISVNAIRTPAAIKNQLQTGISPTSLRGGYPTVTYGNVNFATGCHRLD